MFGQFVALCPRCNGETAHKSCFIPNMETALYASSAEAITDEWLTVSLDVPI
jgi:hypothetical protein